MDHGRVYVPTSAGTDTLAYTATGHYPGGYTADVSSLATWTTNQPSSQTAQFRTGLAGQRITGFVKNTSVDMCVLRERVDISDSGRGATSLEGSYGSCPKKPCRVSEACMPFRWNIRRLKQKRQHK